MIGFRVDANERIATGHLMRCISIAVQCQKLGEECIFFMAEDKEAKRLQEKGIPYEILTKQQSICSPDMECPINMESEINIMKRLVVDKELKWLVVDSYEATASYLTALDKCVPVLYIDDMCKELYPIAALLHYSQWPDEASYEEKYRDTATHVLAGMQYAPLREEFCDRISRGRREKSILITTGGTDTYNVSGRLLQYCMKRQEFADYVFHVIIGSLNQHESMLQELAGNNANIQLHKNVRNMSDYMRSCEMAVSAGGTTLFELCACKIPAVCFSFADNQKGFTEEMGQREMMLCAGDARVHDGIEARIGERLLTYMENKDLRRAYANRMGELVDGCGSLRIAEFLRK